MVEFFSDYGLFLAKALTIVFAIIFVMGVAMSNAARARKGHDKGQLVITPLNDELDDARNELSRQIIDKALFKQQRKAEKKAEKQAEKAKKKDRKQQKGKTLAEADESDRKRIFVIDFQGDPKASQVDEMRKVISAVLMVARPKQDEVLLRLESPGGMVHGYGLAASQLKRVREADIPLTICVDKVAASGGYMMACIGNRIVAAPFAYIGSVGVLLQLPNFHRLLQEHNIDYEMITAGEYKRTLTMFGENTDKGRSKVSEEIQEAHDLFKDFIREHRPQLDVDAIASGETWFGTKALTLSLVDEVSTSDSCIVKACEHADVYQVAYEHKHKLSEKLGSVVESAMDNTLLKWLQRSKNEKFFS